MPSRMPMFISNGRPPLKLIQAALKVPNKPTPPTVLHAPMISRIHNVQPGCNSCGKH